MSGNKKVEMSVCVVVLFLGIVTLKIIVGVEPIIDQWSDSYVSQWNGTIVFQVFRWITELGSGSFITPFILLFGLVYYWFFRKITPALWIIGGAFLGYRINYWIKLLIQRERPSIFEAAEGVGYSFPSGHAMGAMITYGLILYYLNKEIKNGSIRLGIQIIFVSLILLIGLSRYVINVHYLSDVLAGFGYGYLFLILWIQLFNYLSKRYNKKHS
ncbi:PAP2 superfamily protein [Paraliobacillus sp. PM-2]|uniref:phosphatase PAP2 family protein n=1 Tax=Paraliobacillus sp. PM-2 TaxID=1462524 RepID=UPI00061C25DD|nr:phosphatase PAP2 family protein [Paraliobacillus sp. PM-2]CQR47032.1 PAP2 superfamily protein [Paraliobacillus sp. PM-2]